jgi:hypothetical protein
MDLQGATHRRRNARGQRTYYLFTRRLFIGFWLHRAQSLAVVLHKVVNASVSHLIMLKVKKKREKRKTKWPCELFQLFGKAPKLSGEKQSKINIPLRHMWQFELNEMGRVDETRMPLMQNEQKHSLNICVIWTLVTAMCSSFSIGWGACILLCKCCRWTQLR